MAVRCLGSWCVTRCICAWTVPHVRDLSVPAAGRSATCVVNRRSVLRHITWCRTICWIVRMSCCDGRAMPSELLGEQPRMHGLPRLVQVLAAIEKSRARISAEVRQDDEAGAVGAIH